MSCLLSRAQQDTSGPGNCQPLRCLWTKHHRRTCDIEPRWQLFPTSFIWVETYRYVGWKRGVSSHWNTDYLLENLSRKNQEKLTYKEFKHLDGIIFRVLSLILESEDFFTKYASSWPKNTKYLYLRLPFFKWRRSELYMYLRVYFSVFSEKWLYIGSKLKDLKGVCEILIQ